MYFLRSGHGVFALIGTDGKTVASFLSFFVSVIFHQWQGNDNYPRGGSMHYGFSMPPAQNQTPVNVEGLFQITEVLNTVYHLMFIGPCIIVIVEE
jgi:hypothetical protein